MSASEMWEILRSILLLQEYNTRLVLISTTLLGITSGLIGCFLLLRKRSLMGDALSHATLPGIVLAFMILVGMGATGRELPWLLAGAAFTAGLGGLVVLVVRHNSKLKEDAAMGIVLSVFFGAGVVLLGIVQNLPQASAAGLESFLYGKTAAMVFSDFLFIMGGTLVALLTCLLLYKELRMLCFDQAYAQAQGWPVKRLDFLLLLLVTMVTVIGLQAVGLVLMIAFLIIPAAAARLWTRRFARLLAGSAVLGGASGWLGVAISALAPGWPAGALIVLTASSLFLFSLLFGPERGVVMRWRRSQLLHRRVLHQHLMRAVFELLESEDQTDGSPLRPIPFENVLSKRSWSRAELRRIVRRAFNDALLEETDGSCILLTSAGWKEAIRVTRNHRLWEIYLVEYADIAPSHVDRDADAVEHILGREMVGKLEASLPSHLKLLPQTVPASPHPLS